MIRQTLNRYFSLSTKNFEKIYKLGQGANCNVYNVISLDNKKLYTCKEYLNNCKNQIYKEEKCLKLIKSRNDILPKYYSTIIEKDKVWLLTDYIEGMELFEKYCSKHREKLNEETIKPVLMQIINCIEESNKNNIVHLDIKPENFIVSSYNNKISLVDFGSSQPFKDKNKLYSLKSHNIGTETYCSPEILYANNYHVNSDIWSLGVCIYSLLENKTLFCNDEKRKYENINKYLKKFSPQLQDLLKKIFVNNPQYRINLEEIKKHPFIEGKGS